MQREIQDAARRVWFEHHYGDMRTPRLRSEKHGEVERCAEKLKGYLYPPWESPEGRQSDHACTRVLCCGHTQRESCLTFITLPNPDREALKHMAYARGLWVGDLLGALVKPAARRVASVSGHGRWHFVALLQSSRSTRGGDRPRLCLTAQRGADAGGTGPVGPVCAFGRRESLLSSAVGENAPDASPLVDDFT